MRAFLIILLWFAAIHGASGDPVLVLYPEAPDPYRLAFEQLMTGIARTVGGPVQRRMVTATTERAQIQSWLDSVERDTAVVILGQPTTVLVELGQDRRAGRRVFVGGVNALPGHVPWPGVSLIVEPTLYLQTLRELLPNIRRVIAFYHAQDSAWVPLATRAAASVGVSVEPVAVTDVVSAVREVTQALKTLDPQTTALWFTANTLDLDPELLVPFVLERAWDQNIAVFSDTVTHAKRGFLFALYPDYTEIGAELGQRIRQGAAGQTAGFTLTRAARFALNGRTARHLGIPLSDDLIRRADPLYPQP